MLTSNAGLPPKNGVVYQVLIVARISTEHQDPRSLSDQETLCRQWADSNVSGQTNVRVIESQGSGELLDRQELRDLETAIESNKYDFLIVEDVGRICRRHRVHDFLEMAIDNDTRVIAINDHIDTLVDDWKLKISFASMHHEISNADTGKRIRRTLRSRHMQGLVVQCLPYGYIKPHPGASDQEVTKDPAAEPIIEEIFSRLENGVSYSEVVDWLNAEKIPTGKYVSSNRWTVSTLRNLVYNPLLKGVRVRNRVKSKRINKTGRRKSIKAAPDELLERYCPHLAFVETHRYDALIRFLDKKNAAYRRKKVDGRDPRAMVPKKRTRFPGQQVFCAVCGHPMRWGGHGQVDRLVCKGAKEYKCWQGATFDGNLASEKILAAVFQAIEALPGFTENLQSQVIEESRAFTDARDSEKKQIQKRIDKLNREMGNLIKFVKSGNHSEALMKEIAETEKQLDEASFEMQELDAHRSLVPKLPSSDKVRELAMDAITKGLDCPYRLSRVMRTLVPRIEAHPVRLCDGGAIVVRATFELNLCPLFPGLNEFSLAREVMTQTLEVDLFEPVQRELCREQVVELRSKGMYQRDIAAQLDITQPVVQNALTLQDTMDTLGLKDPYVPVTEAPTDLGRMRRHLHPRFKFQPYDTGS
ncbi:recombinase family protein [Bremerella sp. P1]|uniref:recombinase family protein n=1 Tax=Bremerella sp. P1 TaxID=3026424 RepID=UPI00236854B1|nr:recombinase family protein [Bremerella sp. P1]WDI43774.1 recombinase family protein [Bremerella sp. P1]